MIFDGRSFAREIEATISSRLRSGVRVPKVVSILVGNDPASELYTRLKSEAAKRCGIEFEVIRLARWQDIVGVMRRLSETADGIMVQLPIPGPRGEASLQGQALEEVLEAIPLAKDVDGLRWEESGIMPATVKAIFTILESIANNQIPNSNNQTNSNNQILNWKTGAEFWQQQFVVIGAKGAVGRPLVVKLRERGVRVIELDIGDDLTSAREGGVVISCTGKAGLVTGEMVREGVIAIDVGSPKGDMTQEVYDKASVSVEVPGGVGPVTIACLLQNAVGIYDWRRRI